MRIIIDTDIQAVIVPDSYYMQVDKLNEIIEEAGGKKLDYAEYIKSCFDKAYNTRIVRSSDVAKVKGTKKAKKGGGNSDAPQDDKPAASDKPAEAPKEGE